MPEKKSVYDEVQDAHDDMRSEIDLRILWIIIPIVVGGVVSMFSNFEQDVQLIIWGVMLLIAMFGLWSHNVRVLRRKRENLERQRWDSLIDNFDKKFKEMSCNSDNRYAMFSKRFDELDRRFDTSEQTDKTLLRSEIIKFHREWVEEKGYITLESLEYVDRIHEAYMNIGGNGTGDKLWREIHELPIREGRDVK